MWYRVFSSAEAEPQPEALLAHLNRITEVEGHFHGDDAGWFHADLFCNVSPLSLDRYTATEEGIRAELNSWAALVEASDDENATALMEQIIQTQQLFVLRGSDTDQSLGVALCQYLARATNGVYQIDGSGFFSSTGTNLWRET